MPKIYTNMRRKAKDNIELDSLTITLPKTVVTELKERGIESCRGSGNISNYVEAASLAVLGLFYDPQMASVQLLRMIRNDAAASDARLELAANLELAAQHLRETYA